MTRKLTLVCLLVVCFCTAFMSNVVLANENAAQKKIGVLQLNNDTSIPQFGQTAADALTSDLVRLGSCTVIERTELDRVIAEQRLSGQGLLDPSTATQLGGILGIDYLLMGTVSGSVTTQKGHYNYNETTKKHEWVKEKSHNNVNLILKLVDVKNGKVIWAAQQSVSGEDANINYSLEEAAYDSIRAIYKFIPIQGHVVKAEGNQYYIDLGSNNNIAVNDILAVSGIGDVMKHPVTGEIIPIKKDIGFLKVTKVSEDFCIAIVKDGTELHGKIREGDTVTRQLHKKTSAFFGLVWSGKHEF